MPPSEDREGAAPCQIQLFTILHYVSIAFCISSLFMDSFAFFDCWHKTRTHEELRAPFRHAAKEIADSRDWPPWQTKAEINEVPACALSPSPSQEAESARVNSDFEGSPQF